jgi:copper transport protein
MTELLEGALPLVQRTALFAGVLLLVGAWAWRSWIAPGAAGEPVGDPSSTGSHLGYIERSLQGVAALVALLLLPVWGMRLWVQLLGFRDPFAPLSEDLSFLVFDTFWGKVWMAQGALFLALALGFGILARQRPDRVEGRVPWGDPSPGASLPWSWKFLGAGVVGVVATLSLSSHALSIEAFPTLAVALDGVHTLAAGAWIGSLALILAVGRGPVFARQLHAFSPVAMVSVGLLVFAGGILATQHVGTWENLWTTAYGRVFLGKVGLAGGVLLLGFVNWRRGLPTVDSPDGARATARRAWLEVGVALLVLLATAILTGTPMPEGVH